MSERVLLVTIDFARKEEWPLDEVAEELRQLAVACEGKVLDQVDCRVTKPSAAYLIREGKAKEIAERCALNSIETVVFSHDLKGSQQRNLEEIIKAKTIDRTQLILDIFARRATSQEGKMQVELAQLQYLLPRLVGKGIELSRLGGGIGTLGPGETKLEVDRRRIGTRIAKLKRELKQVSANRKIKRKKRKEKGVPTISMVGYTNAGKSTLLNVLTKAQQETKDGLFTTLDSLARQYTLPNHQKIVFSDTVGFMHELPHHLIEAFKATLEEVKEADLLLHVVDVSHPQYHNFYDAVIQVLVELEAHDKPMITVFNKIDKLEDEQWLKDVKQNFEHAVCISALKKSGIPDLNEKIIALLAQNYQQIEIKIPINRMDWVNMIHEQGQVYFIKYYNQYIHLSAAVPTNLANKLKSYIISQKQENG